MRLIACYNVPRKIPSRFFLTHMRTCTHIHTYIYIHCTHTNTHTHTHIHTHIYTHTYINTSIHPSWYRTMSKNRISVFNINLFSLTPFVFRQFKYDVSDYWGKRLI